MQLRVGQPRMIRLCVIELDQTRTPLTRRRPADTIGGSVDRKARLVLVRALFTALLAAATLGALATPASANCGEIGIPGKPPLIIFHC